MIFSELYGAYYNAMAKIIEAAIDHPIEIGEIRDIVGKYAFNESIINIENSISEEKWQLIKRDGSTSLVNTPSMPLTILQKRWLKSLMQDPRMKLFGVVIEGLEDVEPLFTPEDFCVFDKYLDGDPFEDEGYIRNFRIILDAIKNKQPLKVTTSNRKGRDLKFVVMPEHLEYSEKDDKFRLVGSGCKYGDTINLARIIHCEPYTDTYESRKKTRRSKKISVEFELVDERNALERAMMHFAHFEKQAEHIGEKRYRVSIKYDKDDETEILIRILSFGPMIKVVSPNHFVDLIKDRLQKQKSCGH